ncbi:MAG: hypothetical protein EXR43_01330 [Dehalococcoidia bacterium]|nr:hypothetical protein [Dehalococcoidia bacterium]
MAVLLIAAATPGAGKTSVAAALAMKLATEGHAVQVCRILPDGPGDPNALDDGRVFGSLPFVQEGRRTLSAAEARELAQAHGSGERTLILESPRGADTGALAAMLGATVVLVLRGGPGAWPALPDVGGTLGGLIAVAVAVPEPELAAARERLAALGPSLGALPEERVLYAPSIGEIARALGAEVVYDSGNLDETMAHLVVAPVSADAGRPYFERFPHKVVITRVDRPDLILSAFNGGANCLVLCGREAPMQYVVDRAHHEEVTILLSHRSTAETVGALEGIYDGTRFGGALKLERMTALFDEHADAGWVLGAAPA